jgi:DNA-binding Lrp family transcriptional regulator
MDDTDRKLLVLIGAEPRVHYQALAKRLGISRQAIHHRMQMLTETGVLKSITANISIPYLDAVPMVVFGRSRTASIERTLDKLGESDLTRRVLVSGGNYLYIIGLLRKILDLESYVEFVTQSAEMPEPTVGIYCLDDGLMPGYSVDGSGKRKESYKALSPVDIKIIVALRDNARRPIAEIAALLGISAKTVRRHLEEMISDGSLDLSVPVDAQSGGDMLLTMHVNIRDGADKVEVGRMLLSKYAFQDQYIRTFSNLPGLLIWVVWSDRIAKVRKVLREVGEEEEVLAVMLNFVYIERLYETWRDRLPAAMSRSSDRARPRLPKSELKR